MSTENRATETVVKLNFDPVVLEVNDESYYFINYDVAVDFLRDFEDFLGTVLPDKELEEGNDYVIEDVKFFLTAEEAFEAIVNTK